MARVSWPNLRSSRSETGNVVKRKRFMICAAILGAVLVLAPGAVAAPGKGKGGGSEGTPPSPPVTVTTKLAPPYAYTAAEPDCVGLRSNGLRGHDLGFRHCGWADHQTGELYADAYVDAREEDYYGTYPAEGAPAAALWAQHGISAPASRITYTITYDIRRAAASVKGGVAAVSIKAGIEAWCEGCTATTTEVLADSTGVTSSGIGTLTFSLTNGAAALPAGTYRPWIALDANVRAWYGYDSSYPWTYCGSPDFYYIPSCEIRDRNVYKANGEATAEVLVKVIQVSVTS